jgi:diguanylate cyclase (GGDEF)-like protein/PAS domain S-box-containing protein
MSSSLSSDPLVAAVASANQAAEIEHVFSHAPIGLARLTTDGVICWANHAFATVLDARIDTLLDTKLYDLVDKTGPRVLVEQAVTAAVAGRGRVLDVDLRAPHPRAHTKHCTLRVWRTDTEPAALLVALDRAPHPPVAVDVADLATLMERAGAGIARIEPDLSMRSCNPRWTEITGQPRSDALGLGWLAHVDLDGRDEFLDALREASRQTHRLHGRLRLLTVDRTIRWIDVVATPLPAPDAASAHGAAGAAGAAGAPGVPGQEPTGGAPMVLTFSDITDDVEADRRAEELTRVLEATPDLVAILDPTGHTLSWANDAFRRFLQPREAGETSMLTLLDEWSQAQYATSALAALGRTGSWQGELTFTNGFGDEIPVSALLVAHHGDDGAIESVSLVARDLSDLRDAEQRVRASEIRLAALVEHASDLVCVVRPGGRIVYTSPAVLRVLGHPPVDLEGTNVFTLIHPEDLDRARAATAELVATPRKSGPIELRVRHADGSWRHFEVVATNLVDNPAVNGLVLNARDVSDRVEAAEILATRAYHDELTGLPNRALLLERLREALRQAQDRRRLVGVLFLDLDRFKIVNDSLGHIAGDELLREVARRIQEIIRPGDTVARLGGDEFVVIINGMVRRGDAVLAARRLRRAIAKPIKLGSDSTVVTTSLGIAVAEGHETPEDLLRDSDTALYRAKEQGRDRADMFDDHLRDQAVRRHTVEQQLRRALDERLVEVLYQPIVDLRTDAITGAEALVRLREADGSLMPPGEFIDIAEDTGLITRLGAQVLALASRRAASWVTRYAGRDLHVAVNVSARQMADASFAQQVQAELASTGLPAERLSLELTESALIDGNPTTARTLDQLTALGVQIGLDDFGTGFSSLAYLKRFPIDFVKIDRTFTDGLGVDDNDTAIVRATIALAHSLGLRVVAEGVETTTQRDLLRELGCDFGQGYLFAKPLDIMTYESMLLG